MQPTPHISKEWWPREIILTTRQKENQLIGENMQELADKENCIRKTDMTARLEAEGGFFRYATSGESGGIALKTSDRRLANQPDISPLDVEKLLVLYRACVQNAGDLLIESILLAKYAKYHRATFLVITAFEEMGKAQLVADYADNAISAREFKKAFGDHSFKIAYMNRFISLHAAGPAETQAK